MKKKFLIISSLALLSSCASHSTALSDKYDKIEQLKAQGKRPMTVNDKMESYKGKNVNVLAEDISSQLLEKNNLILSVPNILKDIKPIHSGYKVLFVENDFTYGRSCQTNVYLDSKNIIVGWDFLPRDNKQCVEPVKNPKAVSALAQMATGVLGVDTSKEQKVNYIPQLTDGTVAYNTPIPKPTETRNWTKGDVMIDYIGLSKVELIDKQGIYDRTDKLPGNIELLIWSNQWSDTRVHTNSWGYATGSTTDNYKCNVGVYLKNNKVVGWKISGNCSDETNAGGVVSSVVPIPKSPM